MSNKILLSLSLLFGFATSAQATSLHPCTPVVELQPMLQSCVQDDLYYSIEIRVTSSDPELCAPDQQIQRYTAEVEVTDSIGTPYGEYLIQDGEFTFTLGNSSDGTFVSPKFDLDLQSCSSPMHGAFSIGN